MSATPGARSRVRKLGGLFFAALLVVMFALAAWAASRRSGQKKPSAAGALSPIQFARHGNAAEIPMELAAGAVFVPGQVDGSRPSSWLLDTASPRTAVDPAVAAEIGFDPASAQRLALPAVAILQPHFLSEKLQDLGPWYGQRVTGVLGLDFLARVVAELNYARLSIELYDPASWRSSGNVIKLDVHWMGGLPTVAARLRLAGREVDGNFVLDTGGSNGVVVSSRFLAAHGMFPFKGETMPWTAVDASGARDVWLTRGAWLQLGDAEIRRPLVSILQEEKPALESGKNISREKEKAGGIAGWIGGEILKKFRLVLDFPQNRIELAPNRDFVFPLEPDASGATVIATGPGLREYQIRSVNPGSPAAQAGLYPGDEILVIEGESAKDLNLDQIRDLFTQTGKSTVLLVRRLGHNLRVELKLHSPI